MTLYDKIINIYSELSSVDLETNGVVLQNDGQGDYIAVWNHPTLAKPTQEQLDAVETP